MEQATENINGKSWKVGTIDIDYNGKPQKVKIRRISEGMKNDINSKSIIVKVVGGREEVNVNHSLLKELSLVAGIIDAPFPISQNDIRDLDPEVAQQIWDAYQEINQVKEKKNQINT